MYEIHIVKYKNHPNEGCRVDKDTYEKYGLTVSIERYKNENHISPDLTHVSYTGIEQILHENCKFTDSINWDLQSPIKHSKPYCYAWTLPEEEIIKIAAQHGINLIFEDQLSIKTDFLNPANALEVTLIDGYYDEVWNVYTYTVIPDYKAYKASQQTGNENYETIRPENYDAGARIRQSLLALGGSSGWECWEVAFHQAVDGELIKRAKMEHNLNISVRDTNI